MTATAARARRGAGVAARDRARGVLDRAGGWESLRTALAAWAVSRAVVLLAALAAGLVLGPPARGVAPGVPRSLDLLGGWDTLWYLDIAAHGYAHDAGQVGEAYTNLAFFPLVPLLAAGASAVGLPPFALLVVVANGAFLAALWGLHALVRGRAGDASARRAVWALALLPASYAASLAYGEGLMLALAVLAALAAVRGRRVTAALLAAPAPLVRAPALLVPALVAALAAGAGPPRARLRRALLVAAPGVLALAAFLAWMWVARGSPLLPGRAQEAWGGRPLVGWITTRDRWGDGLGDVLRARATGAAAGTLRDVGFGALYVALLARLWRREGGLRSPWVAYSALCLAVPLTTFGPTALARYGLVAFPLAWSLGDWAGAHPRAQRVLVAAAPVGTLLLVALMRVRSP